MTSDWEEFTSQASWFLLNASVDVKKSLSSKSCIHCTVAFHRLFPELTKLLNLATVTHVEAGESAYNLFCWDNINQKRMGWLCPISESMPSQKLFSAHQILLQTFGGIVESFNGPSDTWLDNINDVLTVAIAQNDASFLTEWKYIFEEEGLEIPIKLRDFYSIAEEANANQTLCNRSTGEILMFAYDHCYDHLTMLDGCPECTLYRINNAATFVQWVEHIAKQWLSGISG